MDIVRFWGWKTFTIIYENNDGIVRLQELLKAHDQTPYPINVRQLSASGDYRYSISNIELKNDYFRS